MINGGNNDNNNNNNDNGKCELLGPFALFVQGLMGIIVVSTLVWKRYHERPVRRSWEVWAFDVSKQIIGASFVHIINIFISIISKVRQKDIKFHRIVDNPCDYYFLNLLFDTTVGIPILYGCIIGLTKICKLIGLVGVECGEYGNPPKFNYYFKQLIIFLLSTVIMKGTIYETMITFPILVRLAMWALSRLDKYPTIQEGFVLLVFPLVMNVLQYYTVDTLIKGHHQRVSL